MEFERCPPAGGQLKCCDDAVELLPLVLNLEAHTPANQRGCPPVNVSVGRIATNSIVSSDVNWNSHPRLVIDDPHFKRRRDEARRKQQANERDEER